jgi:predicted S18 family serine protease
MEFIQIENNLKSLLNSSKKNKHELVLNCLKDFEILGFKISKQYLKGLYENKNKNQIRSNISYLIKNLNCEIQKENKYFSEMVFKKSTDRIYIKNQQLSFFYKQHKKKVFDFIVINPNEIKKLIENRQNLLRTTLNFYPEHTLKYFFNLID